MEVWIPYGHLETLLTIQAENLGELVDPRSEDKGKDLAAQLAEGLKQTEKVFVCDFKGATIKILKYLLAQSPPSDALKVYSPFAREIETAVPQLKGRVMKLSQTREKVAVEGEIEMSAPPEFLDQAKKTFIATLEPDPLFGAIDARVACCLTCMANSRRAAYSKKETDSPLVLAKNPCYDYLVELGNKIPGAKYLTIASKGGEPQNLIEDEEGGGAGMEKLKSQFTSVGVSPAKGIVVAPGGTGYDETLSHAVRAIWSSVEAVRKSGEIFLIAECREGIGSEGMQMFVSGRISDQSKKNVYADGLEEIGYIKELNEDYNVTMLSSLPQVYVETKLGLRSTSGTNEGIGRILSSAGRNSKIHVITRACETLLTKV